MSEPSRPPPPATYVPSKVHPNGAPKNDVNLVDIDDGKAWKREKRSLF